MHVICMNVLSFCVYICMCVDIEMYFLQYSLRLHLSVCFPLCSSSFSLSVFPVSSLLHPFSLSVSLFIGCILLNSG